MRFRINYKVKPARNERDQSIDKLRMERCWTQSQRRVTLGVGGRPGMPVTDSYYLPLPVVPLRVVWMPPLARLDPFALGALL